MYVQEVILAVDYDDLHCPEDHRQVEHPSQVLVAFRPITIGVGAFIPVASAYGSPRDVH